jgi:hypothetical protein
VAVKLEAPDLVRPVGIVHRKRKKFSRAAQGVSGIAGGRGVGGDRINGAAL